MSGSDGESAEAHRDDGASRNRHATRSAVQEPPTVYDVVELPEDAPWRSCQRYRQGDHGMEPCGEPAKFVFVYEANIHDDDDRRDNCLACAECCPAVSADIHAEHTARTDGGRNRSSEAQQPSRSHEEQLRIDLLNAFYTAFKNGVDREDAEQHVRDTIEMAVEDAGGDDSE